MLDLASALVSAACIAILALVGFGVYCLWTTHDNDLKTIVPPPDAPPQCGGHPNLCDRGGCQHCTGTTPPTPPRSAA